MAAGQAAAQRALAIVLGQHSPALITLNLMTGYMFIGKVIRNMLFWLQEGNNTTTACSFQTASMNIEDVRLLQELR